MNTKINAVYSPDKSIYGGIFGEYCNMNSFKRQKDFLTNSGIKVEEGVNTLLIKLNDECIELDLSYAKVLTEWIMSTAQTINNKIKD